MWFGLLGGEKEVFVVLRFYTNRTACSDEMTSFNRFLYDFHFPLFCCFGVF